MVISNLARKIFEVATICSLYLFESNLTESKNLPAQDKFEKRMSKILSKQTEIKLLISLAKSYFENAPKPLTEIIFSS